MDVRVHTEFDTRLAPEGVVSTLTDFSPRRPEVWRALDRTKYKLHEVGDTYAVVTEGSHRPDVWARERYDWSHPGFVSWAAEDSNFSAPGSGVEIAVSPADGGGSHVAMDWHRRPRGIKGYVLVGLMKIVGGQMLKSNYKAVFDRVAQQG